MATRTVQGTGGNWSAVGTWVEGAVPLAADAVVVPTATSVIVNDTAAVALSVSVTGTVSFSRTANSTLTVQGKVTVNNLGTWDQGKDSDVIPAAYTATLVLNNAASAAATWFEGVSGFASITFNGVEDRTRWSTLTASMSAGATTCSVASSTGWAVGDELIFAPSSGTDSGTEDAIDVRTITGLAPITFAATTYAHASGAAVGNTYSNCIVKCANASFRGKMLFVLKNSAVDVLSIRYAKFENFSDSSNRCVIELNADDNSSAAQYRARKLKSFYANIVTCTTAGFSAWTGIGGFNGGAGPSSTYVIDNSIWYHSVYEQGVAFSGLSGSTIQNNMVCTGFVYAPTSMGQLTTLNDNHFAGRGGNVGWGAAKQIYNRNKFYGRWMSLFIMDKNTLVTEMHDNDFGVAVPLVLRYLNNFVRNVGYAAVWDFTSENDKYNTILNTFSDPETTYAGHAASSKGVFINKNNDITQQEIHRGTGKIFRNNSTTKRSTSSVSLKPLSVGVNLEHDIPIPVVSGEVVEVAGYLRYDATFYNSGTWVAPTAKLIDADGTTVLQTFTPAASATPAWYPFILTGTAGSTGNMTVRFTANPSSVITGTVYFDGVANSPMIVLARHFGFTFDEANPKRIRNPAVTTTGYTTGALETSEATAIGITGIAVTGATSAIALSANKTFQNLYDYTQAWSCINLTYNVPVTGVGIAGNVALTAKGNVTVSDGAVLNGSGSISMGAYTLATEFASGVDYTYTGGTFSHATTVPSFSSGTLSIPTAGTYTFGMSSAGVQFGAASAAWDLSGCTFTGTIAFTTSTGSLAVTVAVPAGTSYTVEGANITVTAPIVSASISITGMPDTIGANDRLQIINTTAAVASAWAALTAYVAGDVVLRSTGVGSESTAGLYMRCTTAGISAGTPPTWNTTVGGTTTDGTAVWTTYAVLYYDADPAATSLTDTYIDGEEFLAGETVEIRFAEEDPAISFKTYSTSVVATADGFSALVNETDDSSYATYATSGVTQDSIFSPNFVANYIVLDTDTNFTASGSYAYYCYLLTTSEGMYRFWGGLTGIDPGNIRNNVSVVSLYFDCSSGFVRQTDDIRIFRSDLTRPALDPVTAAGGGIEINWKVPVNVVTTGGSALTPSESAQLMGLSNDVNVVQVAGSTVTGSGTEADPWGPV